MATESQLIKAGRRVYAPINFVQKLALLNTHWSPRVIAEINDYQFKVVKIVGEFVWHDHPETDEAFVVLEGALRIDFHDGFVELSAGEMFVVPKGIAHKPSADNETKLLLIEPRGVVNTGGVSSALSAPVNVWV